MRPFSYQRPDTPASATEMVARSSAAKFIAGGTNLLDLMKLDIEHPETVVDISRLPLKDIRQIENGLEIGALVTNADLAADLTVRRDYAVLSRALLAGASGQLRNKATTGGNLLQRTRCFYFYNTAMACNKREPGSGCSALEGHNRIHAILGGSENCIATHPSDMAVAMMALDAEIRVQNAAGASRSIPIAEFYRLPGDTPHIETVLEAGDLITSVVLPEPLKGRHVYRKVRDRASYAFALTSVAAIIDTDGGKIRDARLAFGGVAPKPWRNREVETLLVGKAPSRSLWDEAADLLLAEARGYGENDFKIDLLRRTLGAVLTAAAEGEA